VSLLGYSTQNVTDCKRVARRKATCSAGLKVQGVKPASKTQLGRELKHYVAEAVGRSARDGCAVEIASTVQNHTSAGAVPVRAAGERQ
jgi:hypothetical protein